LNPQLQEIIFATIDAAELNEDILDPGLPKQ
jgi:hypothetical protein